MRSASGPASLDPRTAPALELAQVYAQRWEHELYFREIKRQLRKTDVLQSHTRRDRRAGDRRAHPG